MRVFRLVVYFSLGVFLSLVASCAYAVLTIEICGSGVGPSTCAEPAPVTSGSLPGGVSFVCNPYDPNDCLVSSTGVMVNPKTPLATPPGWTAPVPPSIQPTPPTSDITATYKYGMENQGVAGGGSVPYTYDTPADMCAYVDTRDASHTYTYETPYLQFGGCRQSGTNYLFNVSAVSSCPIGYTKNSVPEPDTCTLTNPSVVPKPADGTCTIIRSGNSFSGDSLDPDCAATPGVAVSPSSVVVSPQPSASTNTRVDLNSDGSGKVTITTPDPATSTTSQRVINFGPPDGTTGTSKITGTVASTFSGTGSGQSSTPIGDLPTDYNREATQTAIKGVLDNIKAGQCGAPGQAACKLDETGIPTDGTLATEKAALDSAASAHISAIQGAGSVTDSGIGLSVELPSSSACSDLVFSIPGTGGKSLSVLWCAKQAAIKTVLSFVVAMLTAIYLFSLGASIFDRR